MLDLQPAYALTDAAGECLAYESESLSIKPVTAGHKTRLQVSLNRDWDQHEFEKALGNTLADGPTQTVAEDPGIYWLAPNDWLMVSDTMSVDSLIQMVADHSVFITDMSDHYSRIEIKGSSSVELMQSGTGIDLSSEHFQPGHYRLTRFAELSAIIHRQQDSETFQIIIARSEARYLWDWLITTAELI